jgi:hypothetical protein
MTTLRSALATIVGLSVGTPLTAQSQPALEVAQVLVLGTYHFANPGRDIVQNRIADVLAPNKQEEIREVVEALGRFQPTKIAIESSPASFSRVDSLYREYKLGRHELARSETEQLGFRLAAALNHETLYPIDYRNDFPFEAMMAYAQVKDPAFVTFVEEELARLEAESARVHGENTIGQVLRLRNDPQHLQRDHGTYMRFAGVGAGDTYVGADLVAKWYERNVRIFAELERLLEPGDRVLVIFGSGHAPTLRHFVSSHPDMELVDPLGYLPRD